VWMCVYVDGNRSGASVGDEELEVRAVVRCGLTLKDKLNLTLHLGNQRDDDVWPCRNSIGKINMRTWTHVRFSVGTKQIKPKPAATLHRPP
jgi:hypothetical protein